MVEHERSTTPSPVKALVEMPISTPIDGVELTLLRSSGAGISGDDWLVEPLGSGILRLAVIDGAFSLDAERRPPVGHDAAVFAAGVVRTALRSEESAEEALERANSALFDPAVSPSRLRPSAAVAVIDLERSEEGLFGVAVSAADCFVYAAGIAEVGGWEELVGGDHLNPEARARWTALRAAHLASCPACATSHCSTLLELEAVELDDPSNRSCPAIGRDERLSLRSKEFRAVQALVLSTDGIEPADIPDAPRAAARRLAATPMADVTVLRVTTS